MNDTQLLHWMKDRIDIKNTILKYPTAADSRDWELYNSLFADEVKIDFSSFLGGPKATVKKEDLLLQVKGLIPGFDATQHQLSNFVIDIEGDVASVVAYMQAEHFIFTESIPRHQSVGGHYTYKLKKENNVWKIHELALTVRWSRGEMEIYPIAMQKAQTK